MISNLPIFHGCMGEKMQHEKSPKMKSFSQLFCSSSSEKNIRNRAASWRLGVEKPSQQIFNHSEFWHIQRWGKKRTNLKHKKKNFMKMALQGFNHKKWITLHNSIVHLVTCTMSKKIEPHLTCFICDT